MKQYTMIFARTAAVMMLLGLAAFIQVKAQTATPAYVETNGLIVDDKVYEHILTSTRAMIEARKVTAASKLVGQLDRTQCSVSRPKPAKKVLAAADLYEQHKASVLVVATLYKCHVCPNDHLTAATGFVIGADGLAVTSYHVFNGNATRDRLDLTHVVMDSQGNVYPITEVLAAHKGDDVAIFKIGGGEKLSPVPLADAARVGENVCIIAHPHSMFYSFSSGTLSRMYMREGGEKMTVTADFGQGSSGGPVFNDKGNVVGVVSATLSLYHADGHLQMVSKETIPVQRIRALIR